MAHIITVTTHCTMGVCVCVCLSICWYQTFTDMETLAMHLCPLIRVGIQTSLMSGSIFRASFILGRCMFVLVAYIISFSSCVYSWLVLTCLRCCPDSTCVWRLLPIPLSAVFLHHALVFLPDCSSSLFYFFHVFNLNLTLLLDPT